MKNLSAAAAGICSLLLLIIFPEAAKQAVIHGLQICGGIIIPSLFPFFVSVNLIGELGIIKKLCFMRKNSFEYAAFIIGVSGGYPIGASFLAEAVKRREISAEDASKLLVWCNNSGPAFIIGAVGAGVFGSAAVGILLYAVHILSALIYGKLFCRVESTVSYSNDASVSFSAAFVASVKKSVSAIINVCGFVLTFSVFLDVMNSRGLINIIAGRMAELFHTELQFNNTLIAGLFELGNSIAQMQGLDASPQNLALAAFILGWGGFSVHFQTMSVIADTEIKTARYLIGRFLIAVFAALLAYISALIFRI